MSDSAYMHSGNCLDLATRTGFGVYIQQLNTTTGFNTTLLDLCKNDICNALWGNGNSDVSGIGMLVGYVLESIIGFIFAVILLARTLFPLPGPSSAPVDMWNNSREKFVEGAGYFSASIQIACMIVLVRKDFGISSLGFGGFTVQITWAVAVISILPLLYPLFMLDPLRDKKKKVRLFMFCMSWLPFCYTMFSQMIGDFAPQQVGEGAGPGGTTIVTLDEWSALELLCLAGVVPLSEVEQKVLNSFGAAGSLLVTAYGVSVLLWSAVEHRQWPEQVKKIWRNASSIMSEKQRAICVLWISIILIPALTIPQLWGVLRIRGIQKNLSNASGSSYTDNQWTFGQVTATMLFAPLFIEIGNSLIEHFRKARAG